MYFLIPFIAVWIFTKTFSYGLYEINEQKNKLGGIFVILLAIISLVLSIFILFLRNFY